MLWWVSFVPTAGDDVGAVADRLSHGSYEIRFLRVAGGRGLAGGAVDDESVVACIHQMGGESLRAVEVKCAVRRERRDHCGEDPPEGVCGVEVGAMGNTLLAAQRAVPLGGCQEVWRGWIPALPARGFKQCRVRLIRLDELSEMPQYGHFTRLNRTSVPHSCFSGYGATRPFR